MYTPRTGHAVVVWNHCFYLMGGGWWDRLLEHRFGLVLVGFGGSTALDLHDMEASERSTPTDPRVLLEVSTRKWGEIHGNPCLPQLFRLVAALLERKTGGDTAEGARKAIRKTIFLQESAVFDV